MSKIIKLSSERQDEYKYTFTLYKVDNEYSLKYNGRLRQYWNDGIKINDTYTFYKDTGLGFKERTELTHYSDNDWRYIKLYNTNQYLYDEWRLSTQCSLIPI